MARLAVIADDITGGSAVGAELSRLAFPVAVTGKLSAVAQLASHCDVLVYNTETRNREAQDASRITLEAASVISNLGTSYVIKKIDSMMRGNIAEEIDAIAAAYDFNRCMMIPAAPAVGRITKHGTQYVNGLILNEALRLADPSARHKGSNIAELLRSGTSQVLHSVTVDDLELDIAALADRISGFGPGIVIGDATENRHVEKLVESAFLSGYRFFAGSYGIGAPLGRCLSAEIADAPVLVISGSLSQKSREQVDFLSKRGDCAEVTIDLRYGMSETEREEATSVAREAVKSADAAGLDVVIATSSDGTEAAKLLQGFGLSAVTEMENYLATAILAATAPIFEKYKGVIVSGGATANALLEALGANGLAMHEREVLQGMPVCTIAGGKCDGLYFLSKPGSFGSEQSLADARGILKRIISEERSRRN